MKSLMTAICAVGAAAVAAPALAQTITSPQPYVNLGYTYLNPDNRDLGELTGRIGAKMSPYWGVEGELGGGMFGNKFTNAGGQHVTLTEGLTPAVYGVGFLPLWNGKIDLLARVGYAETPLTVQTANSVFTNTSHSINFGAGAEYMADGHNGIRIDYTRREFQDHDSPRDDDTYAVALVHKF